MGTETGRQWGHTAAWVPQSVWQAGRPPTAMPSSSSLQAQCPPASWLGARERWLLNPQACHLHQSAQACLEVTPAWHWQVRSLGAGRAQAALSSAPCCLKLTHIGRLPMGGCHASHIRYVSPGIGPSSQAWWQAWWHAGRLFTSPCRLPSPSCPSLSPALRVVCLPALQRQPEAAFQPCLPMPCLEVAWWAWLTWAGSRRLPCRPVLSVLLFTFPESLP